MTSGSSWCPARPCTVPVARCVARCAFECERPGWYCCGLAQPPRQSLHARGRAGKVDYRERTRRLWGTWHRHAATTRATSRTSGSHATRQTCVNLQGQDSAGGVTSEQSHCVTGRMSSRTASYGNRRCRALMCADPEPRYTRKRLVGSSCCVTRPVAAHMPRRLPCIVLGGSRTSSARCCCLRWGGPRAWRTRACAAWLC